MVTNAGLSKRLKDAGATQDGAHEWLIGPDDMPEDEKEKVSGFDEEYLLRKIPMTLTLSDKKMAFDFCRAIVEDRIVFASTYRPMNSPLGNRIAVFGAATLTERFVDSLGELYFWLLTKTTAFGDPREKEELESVTAGGTKMEVSEDGNEVTLTDPVEENDD